MKLVLDIEVKIKKSNFNTIHNEMPYYLGQKSVNLLSRQ